LPPERRARADAASATDSERRPQRSLFGEILDWMLAPLLLLWPMSLVIIWLVGPEHRQPAVRPRAGRNGPHAVAPRHARAGGARRQPRGAHRADRRVGAILRGDEPDQFYFQVLGTRGERIAGDRDLPVPDEAAAARWRGAIPRRRPCATSAVRVAYLWVPFHRRGPDKPPLVQVAETLDKRSRWPPRSSRA
jgi:two-component system sensor histidine kinase TctE